VTLTTAGLDSRGHVTEAILARGWGRPSEETQLEAAAQGPEEPEVIRLVIAPDDGIAGYAIADTEPPAIPPANSAR
jgi:hypothetical protein